jgi:hypothetical protein
MAIGPSTLHKDLKVVNRIMGTYNVATDGSTTGTTKVLGVLPKGASIIALACQANVRTAGDGTTPAIKLGTRTAAGVLDDNSLFATTDVDFATDNKMKPGVAATMEAGGLYEPLAEDLEVVATYTGGGSNTAGIVDFIITFVHPLTTGLVE